MLKCSYLFVFLWGFFIRAWISQVKHPSFSVTLKPWPHSRGTKSNLPSSYFILPDRWVWPASCSDTFPTVLAAVVPITTVYLTWGGVVMMTDRGGLHISLLWLAEGPNCTLQVHPAGSEKLKLPDWAVLIKHALQSQNLHSYLLSQIFSETHFITLFSCCLRTYETRLPFFSCLKSKQDCVQTNILLHTTYSLCN